VSHTGIPKLPPAAPSGSGKPSGPAETKAGVKEYNNFFALYAQSLAGDGLVFWPLGFIPGPALLTYGGEVVSATPDVARQLPSVPVRVASLPQRVRQAMEAWANLFQALGFAPTPWSAGAAQRLLSGRKPDGILVIGMPSFRYRPGEMEVPFGVVLTSEKDGMRVARVYNPRHVFPDEPAEGTLLKFSDLKDGRGPVQKLLRTWALMEANFASRYDRQGNPREDRDS
jgi:hypothetical protein